MTDFKTNKAKILTIMLSILAMHEAGASKQFESLENIRQVALQRATTLAEEHGMNVARIEAGRLDSRLQLIQCSAPLTAYSPYETPFTHKTTIAVRCETPNPWTLYVPVTVYTASRALRLTRNIARDTIISADDFKEIQQVTAGNSRPLLEFPGEAEGKRARRDLAKGTLLRANLLEEPLLVEKGDLVAMLVTKGSLQVKTTGEALENGAFGQIIRVENARSGRTVEGRVQNDGSVLVRR